MWMLSASSRDRCDRLDIVTAVASAKNAPFYNGGFRYAVICLFCFWLCVWNGTIGPISSSGAL
jgi:hypothetical protein